ncbi:hypothetical protein B0O80DRAFT_442847 [Mortierella sp. GBAus27b]|nr:hypothetical protein B0O80DRAFT_442847 [Mortierella sp. GBAus27b]
MPNQELAPHQHLAHLLNIDSVRIDKLVLEGSTDDEAVVDAFAKVEGDSTGLREFTMLGVAEGQGDQVIQNIASIVSRSELIKLEVHLNGEERRAEILEPIQWQCIRRLKIIVDNESVGTRAMMASVKGRNGLKEPVELEFFGLGCDSPETMSTGQVELLRSFVASTSIKELQLVVRMALSDMESVVKSVDVSRLEVIYLWANGFTSSQVDHVLDCLRSATKLQKVYLFYYSPTEEQKEKMKTKGVILNELMW